MNKNLLVSNLNQTYFISLKTIFIIHIQVQEQQNLKILMRKIYSLDISGLYAMTDNFSFRLWCSISKGKKDEGTSWKN